MKMCPVGAELFHVDGRTDKQDKANRRFSRFCESVYTQVFISLTNETRLVFVTQKVCILRGVNYTRNPLFVAAKPWLWRLVAVLHDGHTGSVSPCPICSQCSINMFCYQKHKYGGKVWGPSEHRRGNTQHWRQSAAAPCFTSASSYSEAFRK